MSIQPGVGYTFKSSGQGTNLTIEKPWSLWDSPAPQENIFPFKIINTSIVGSAIRYQVAVGTINNLVPLIDDISGSEVKLNRVTGGVANPPTAELTAGNFDATNNTSIICLRAGAKLVTPFNYPDDDDTTNQYPVIIGSNVPLVDDNVWGFIAIGTITVDSISSPTTYTVTQYVTGSLWSDRIKLGSLTAKYYHARI